MAYTTRHQTYRRIVSEDRKARFMRECEQLITAKRPELTGKFSNLRIWDTLQYFYTCNGITPEIAAARILGDPSLSDANHIK